MVSAAVVGRVEEVADDPNLPAPAAGRHLSSCAPIPGLWRGGGAASALTRDPLQEHARGLVARVLGDEAAFEGEFEDGLVKPLSEANRLARLSVRGLGCGQPSIRLRHYTLLFSVGRESATRYSTLLPTLCGYRDECTEDLVITPDETSPAAERGPGRAWRLRVPRAASGWTAAGGDGSFVGQA